MDSNSQHPDLNRPRWPGSCREREPDLERAAASSRRTLHGEGEQEQERFQEAGQARNGLKI